MFVFIFCALLTTMYLTSPVLKASCRPSILRERKSILSRIFSSISSYFCRFLFSNCTSVLILATSFSFLCSTLTWRVSSLTQRSPTMQPRITVRLSVNTIPNTRTGTLQLARPLSLSSGWSVAWGSPGDEATTSQYWGGGVSSCGGGAEGGAAGPAMPYTCGHGSETDFRLHFSVENETETIK